MADNGSHVTWREMNLILGRLGDIEDAVKKLTETVGHLVLSQARDEGRGEVVRDQREWRRQVSLYWRPSLAVAGVSVLTSVGAHFLG